MSVVDRWLWDPHCSYRKIPASSVSYDFENSTSMCHEGDARVVTTLDPFLLVQHFGVDVFPLLHHLAKCPNSSDDSVEYRIAEGYLFNPIWRGSAAVPAGAVAVL